MDKWILTCISRSVVYDNIFTKHNWFHVGTICCMLTHLPLVPIYVSVNWVRIGSDNGLSPGRCQAISWTCADILSIVPQVTHFNGILFEIQIFSFTKMRLYISFVKWWPFCPWGDELSNSCKACTDKLHIYIREQMLIGERSSVHQRPTSSLAKTCVNTLMAWLDWFLDTRLQKWYGNYCRDQPIIEHICMVLGTLWRNSSFGVTQALLDYIRIRSGFWSAVQ